MRLFSRQEIKIFLLVVLLGSLVAVIITLLVMLVPRMNSEEGEPAGRDLPIESEVDITELIFPEEFRNVWEERWYPYRPQFKQWSTDQVEFFWVEPEELLLQHLERINREKLETIFSNAEQ